MSLDILDIDFSGTTDAAGNLTVSQTPSPAYWCSLKVVAQGAGNPQWSVLVNGRAVAFGQGTRADMGPILLHPKSQLAVAVIGGAPGSHVIGKLVGITASTIAEALNFYNPSPNTVAVQTTSSILAMKVNPGDSDIYTVQPNVVLTNVVYPIPVGTQSVRVLVNQNHQNVAFPSLSVVGNRTGILYMSGASAGGTGGFDNPFQPAVEDTALLWSIDATGSANPIQYMLNADLGIGFMFAQIVGNGTASGQPLLVTQQNPQPWQVPNVNGGVGVGGVGGNVLTAIIPAGGAAVRTRLYEVVFGCVALAGAIVTIESPAGIVRANIDASRTHDTQLNFGGLDCGLNADVSYRTNAAGASVSGGHATANQT